MHKILFLFLIVLATSCSTTYYVVRHAEKEAAAPNMTSDVELSAAGKERAQALKNQLEGKKIKQIFSTNTIRTKTTAQPLSDATGIVIQVYDPRDTAFVTRIKNAGNGNVLIVSHSNTVDDLVNKFIDKNELKDLPDTQYGDLFIIKKKGNKYSYSTSHFGK